MAEPLRLVVVSYVDDNFGDNLIRISFHALLDVALADHGLRPEDAVITPMSLKHIDEDLLEAADAIFFAGGGLLGLSYLNFATHVEQIVSTADRRGIPVVFSSIGLNNMGAEGGNTDAMADILRRPSVKAVAVRENLALFETIAEQTSLQIRQVADPAVWTKYVYGMTDVEPDGSIGINVVRGGLFAANDRSWGLTDEMNYLSGLREQAEAAGIRTQLYTNGSLDDNNTLRYFAREYDVPESDIVLPQTTREVIEAIASRSAIASIRMHSSIIAYSFGIPTVSLEWNDKLPHFYKAIGHPERLLSFDEWSAESSFARLQDAGRAPESEAGYRDYLMSTYRYIHEVVGRHVLENARTDAGEQSFEDVAAALTARAERIDEDEFDLRLKIGKAERAYLGRFVKLRAKDHELRELRSSVRSLEKKADVADALRRKISTLQTKNDALTEQLAAQQKELELRFSTRLARFVRRLLRR